MLFEKNIKALEARHPETAEAIRQTGEKPPGARVEQSRRGSPTFSMQTPACGQVYFHSRYDPVAEAEKAVAAMGGISGESFIAVLGQGLGYVPLALAERLLPGQTLVIVEPSLGVFRLALENVGLSGLLQNPAVRLATGPGFMEQLRGIVTDKDYKTVYLFHPPSRAAFPELGEAAEYLERAGAGPLRAALRYPKFAGEPFRTLVFESGFFVEKELMAALDKIGAPFETAPASVAGIAGRSFTKGMLERAVRFRPDFIISINQIGFDVDGALTGVLEYYRIPFVHWFVDNPLPIVRNGPANASRMGLCLVWDRSYVEPMRRLGYENCEYLPYGADDTVFHPSGKPAAKKYPVSFVGSSMQPLIDRRLEEMKANPGLMAAYKKLSQGAPPQRREDIGEMIRRNAAGAKADEAALASLEAAVVSRWSQKRRVEHLLALEKFGPHVFGDAAWRNLLPPSFTFHPPVDYRTGLADVYRETAVNINISSPQLLNSPNQRLFDVSACGSFLLTDGAAAAPEFLEPGRGVETYSSPEELSDKTGLYLEQPEKRMGIEREASRVILENHTYAHRVVELFEMAQKTFAG